ncbi:hypothetical protein N2602_34300 [Bradyrhizobium sp. NC92]|nr:hypothetical protein [Bradyrhizobium sp. NC92]UWU68133.1 hypothetical protein N2602_34300 [Bradyrhizobium sp. NC92]
MTHITVGALSAVEQHCGGSELPMGRLLSHSNERLPPILAANMLLRFRAAPFDFCLR